MKLIYIANVRLPTEKAHGIQIMKVCEAFVQAGVQVELVVPKRRNPQFQQVDPFEYYGVKSNFKIQKLSVPDPWWLLLMPQGVYIKVQTFFLLLRLYFYLRSLKKQGGKIFYTREEYLLPILQRFSTPSQSPPYQGGERGGIVWEAHTLPSNKDYYLKYWKNCLRIVAISRGLKEELARLGVAQNKILVAPDGVDLEKFITPTSSPPYQGGEREGVREELGLPLDKKIVMYTGHLYEWKGAQTLLAAAKNFSTPTSSPPYQGGEREGVLFVFVGGTEHDIAKFKKRAEGVDNVLILGHKPNAQIPKYLAAADALVLPNSGKFEISRIHTSPLKLFEYMAAGRPIVASDLPSIREILDEEAAVFSIPDDPEDLAEKIRKVLSDSSLAEQIVRNAKEKVKQYTWDDRAKKIIEFISL